MLNTKILLLYILIISAISVLFIVPTTLANHGFNELGCDNVPLTERALCIEHARIDAQKQICEDNFQNNQNEAARETCLERIEASDDGYDGTAGSVNTGSGGSASGSSEISCDTVNGQFTCFNLDIEASGDARNNPLYSNLNQIISFLSVGVGVLIAVSVTVSGIQWATSGGDPGKRAKAVGRIWNAAIALMLYIFGWALLNWLIPGGVFG